MAPPHKSCPCNKSRLAKLHQQRALSQEMRHLPAVRRAQRLRLMEQAPARLGNKAIQSTFQRQWMQVCSLRQSLSSLLRNSVTYHACPSWHRIQRWMPHQLHVQDMTLRNHRCHNLWKILQQARKAMERQMIGSSSSRSGCRCLQAWQRQQGCKSEAKAKLS